MMPTQHTWVATGATLAFALVAASSGLAADLIEEDFLGSVPIVLSATRLAQTPIESPSSLTIVDREMIRASGARQIADVMALVPGFQIGYIRGNRPVVTYHGLGDEFARRLQVLIDGRSVYVPLYGGVPWENLPLAVEDIERIEVVRGPNAATFGPNSFSAVINITTRQAFEEQGVMLRGNRGTDGISDGLLRMAGKLGDGFYRLTLGRQADDGFENRTDSSDSDLLTVRYDRPLGLRDELTLQAGSNQGDNEQGEAATARNTSAKYSYYQARWERVFNPRESLTVQVFGSRYEVDDRLLQINPTPAVASVFVDQSAIADRHEVELQWTLNPTERLRTVVGGSLRQDRVRSPGYLDRTDALENDVNRLFGHAEFQASDRLLLNFGTLVETNDISGTDDSPRVALVYKISPQQSLRLSHSRATRTPVIFEEFARQIFDVTLTPAFVAQQGLSSDQTTANFWIATGGLAPERIESTEIGYRLDTDDRRLSLDFKLFDDSIEDVLNDIENANEPVDLLLQRRPTTHANQVDVDIRGAEAGIDWRPTRMLRLVAGYSYMEAESNDRDHAVSVPDHVGSLLAILRLTEHHTLSLDYRHYDEFEWVDGTLFDSYERLDLQFREDFRWRRNLGSFSLILEDVLARHAAYDVDVEHAPRAFLRFSMLFP